MADFDKEYDFMLQRVASLEKRIYGKKHGTINNDTKVLEALGDINNRISNSLAGREKVKSVIKRSDEIEKYLNPAFGRNLTLDDTAKVDIILAEERYIRHTASQLNAVRELKPFLTSEHIQATPLYTEKLTHISKIDLQQEEATARLSDQVKNLMDAYNNIISGLTKQFVHYDDMISKLEAANQPKKSP